jgi:putative tryptophan/tyrosine transport system substrate-binding protein
MRRREFIALFGGGAAWPFGVRAQQQKMPIIGFLSARSQSVSGNLVTWFREGLASLGFAEGRNVAIEYRWADGDYERLRGFAVELVGLPVAAIAAISGTPAALAAKAVTSTVPIVFANGGDPVISGLVPSLNRPGGNITGATFLNTGIATKRLELLRDLLPKAKVIAFLANPNNPVVAPETASLTDAAHSLGFDPLHIVNAGKEGEFEVAFSALVQQHADAVLIASDPLFVTLRNELAARAARLAIPMISADRDVTEAGGLMSYGGSIAEAYRQAGVYVGRILNGEKAGDLPVLQPTKFELVLNLKTAKALGISVPQALLATADEVIE